VAEGISDISNQISGSGDQRPAIRKQARMTRRRAEKKIHHRDSREAAERTERM
jgi:hypothetical protein